MDWKVAFDQGLSYEAFLKAHGTPAHQGRWASVHDSVRLNAEQAALLGGFTRRMNVLCLAGAWCGDCVNQCPVLQRFAESSPRIDLRFLDRDKHADLQEMLSMNGGHRVPVVVFLSEDMQECARYGDRTLSQYRRLASSLAGAACPTGIGQETDVLAATTAEWLAEFERIQWMLRLSPRLRQRHND